MQEDTPKWRGIVCTDSGWAYAAAQPHVGEARRAVKRLATRATDPIINPDRQYDEHVLDLLSAAHAIVEAAKEVEAELVLQAREKGIALGQIGSRLGYAGDSGVNKYISSHALTAEKEDDLQTEREAWEFLLAMWAGEGSDPENDSPTDHLKGERYLKYGLTRVGEVAAGNQATVDVLLDGSDGLQPVLAVFASTKKALEALIDPSIVTTINRHLAVIRGRADSDDLWGSEMETDTRSVILQVVMAWMASVRAEEALSLEDRSRFVAEFVRYHRHISSALDFMDRPGPLELMQSVNRELRADDVESQHT